jgi:hypothetical protein
MSVLFIQCCGFGARAVRAHEKWEREDAGVSYGTDALDQDRRSAAYVDRIPKGFE